MARFPHRSTRKRQLAPEMPASRRACPENRGLALISEKGPGTVRLEKKRFVTVAGGFRPRRRGFGALGGRRLAGFRAKTDLMGRTCGMDRLGNGHPGVLD